MPTKAKRKNFTQAMIRDLPTPKSGRKYHYDAKRPSLACCVTSTGAKSYYWTGRVNGQPKRMKLGSTDSLDIGTARDAAKAEDGKVVSGIDPVIERRKSRQSLTVGEAWRVYREYMVKHGKQYTEADYRWRLHLESLASRRLHTLTRDDINAHHSKLAKDPGAVTANRAISLLRAIINRAIAENKWSGENPAAKFDKIDEGEGRSRYLTADEIPRFFNALAQEANETLRDFFLLALFTGQRKSNVMKMRFDQIDFSTNVWTVPATQAKKRKSITVPLTRPAIEIVKDRRNKIAGDWVLPSYRRAGKVPHMSEPKTAWDRILKRANLKDLVIHDLRRTLASWQANNNTSLEIIGQTLGHTGTDATRIYAKLQSNTVRQAADDAALLIQHAATGTTLPAKTPETTAPAALTPELVAAMAGMSPEQITAIMAGLKGGQ